MAKTQIRGNTQIIAATITDAEIATSAAIASTKLAAWGADRAAGGFKLTGLAAAVSGTDATTLTQVQNLFQGLNSKGSVDALSATNVTNSGTQTIDGVALSAGQLVLLVGQTATAQNGPWTVNAGAWTRPVGFDDANDAVVGAYWLVNGGTVYNGTGWKIDNAAGYSIGSTGLTLSQLFGAGEYTAGSGLTVAGRQFSISGALPAANFPALTGDVTTSAGALASTIPSGTITLAKQATLAANSVIGNSTGSTATPTAVLMNIAATANAVALRDGNANLKANNVASNLATTVTAAGTTTLTSASSRTQQFTGTTTQTVVMPDATTLSVGHNFTVANRSTASVTVNANGGGALQIITAGNQATFTAVTIGTTAGTWDVAYSISTASGSGTVTTVSVASANGFAGTVANATTTPAITVSTTITGILKGNATAVSAATLGTDYVNNASFIARETPTGTVNGSTTVFTMANTPTAGTEMLFLNGILQEPGAGNDYTISTNSITFLTAPVTGDRVRVSYMK